MKTFEMVRTVSAHMIRLAFSFYICIAVCLSTDVAFAQEKRNSSPGINQLPVNSSKEGEDFIKERAEFRRLQRAGENGEIPMGALMRAKQQVDAMRAKATANIKTRSPQDAGIGGWEWLGPGNIGGRIRSILVHPTSPNTMWVGSVSGGLWRTDNSGASWYPVDDFMANLAITSIVMDPNNNSVLYASTGEAFGAGDGLPGAGIFKSVDGGVTWYQLPSTAGMVYVQRLAHHPDSSNIVLAVTASTLWKTTDGGTYWIPLYSLPTAGADVVYHPHHANNILVGTYGDVFYSSDYGTTFTKQTTGATNKLPNTMPGGSGRCEVAFAPSTTLAMYVSIDRNLGEIWQGNFGASVWTLMNTGFNYLGQGGYANSIWVDPIDPDIIVRGGHGASRSTDGGSTWADISPPHEDVHVFVSHPGYNGTTNRTVYLGDDGGLNAAQDIRTIQKGQWINLNNNLGITQFYSGSAAPDGSIIVGGTQDNIQDHYRPAWGVNGWTEPTTGFSGDGGFSAVNYNSPNIVYGEYNSLSIKRSTDGGTNYVEKTSGLLDANVKSLANFVAPFVIDPNNPSILVGGGKRIWRTTDNADNWSQIRDSIPSREACTAIDIEKGNSNVIWVGYAGGTVSHTTDAGASWTNVDGGFTPLPDRWITDIAINPFDGNEVFVTLAGYNFDDVWRTVDFGTSWSQRTGSGGNALPALQVNTVRFNPIYPNWVYVGTDLGIFASEDKGLSWSVSPLYTKNEGPANVEVDELFWQGSQDLIAATHGRGMFRCHLLPIIFVDIANPNQGDGSPGNPYHNISDAINAAGPGTTISIKGGDYPQAPLVFSTRGVVIVTSSGVVIH
jgi:photosystem II stability/assembly factor-like uncharacterized protein